jgi:probable rRNA maturation factor
MEPPSPYRVLLLNDSGRPLATDALERVIFQCLREAGFSQGELSVRLTSDEEIHILNRSYRDIDETTDVLTFPSDGFPVAVEEMQPLGDIAIAAGRADFQASARGISFEEEVAYLAIHGILHLAGLDDETDEQRTKMLSEMDRLGSLCGLPKVADWHTIGAGAAV